MTDQQQAAGDGVKDAAGRLHLQGVTKSFGGRTVVDVEDLQLGSHGVEGIIGPNGAGKTTLMNVITQARRPDSGKVVYRPDRDAGVDLTGMKLDEIARLGVVKTNQVITEFDSLTIRDSMLLSAARPADERFWRLSADQALRRESREQVEVYLDHFHLDEPDGSALSAGEKKLLDIIRCLLLNPRFLLMDEPTAGLPEDQTRRVMDLIRAKATEEDVSIVIADVVTGEPFRTLEGTGEPGMNRVQWNLRGEPQQGGRGGRGGGGGGRGGGQGPQAEPGVYRVTLTAGGEQHTTTIRVLEDIWMGR